MLSLLSCSLGKKGKTVTQNRVRVRVLVIPGAMAYHNPNAWQQSNRTNPTRALRLPTGGPQSVGLGC